MTIRADMSGPYSLSGPLPALFGAVGAAFAASIVAASLGANLLWIAAIYVAAGTGAFVALCALQWRHATRSSRHIEFSAHPKKPDAPCQVPDRWDQIGGNVSSDHVAFGRVMMVGDKLRFDRLEVCHEIEQSGYNADICSSLDTALLSIEEQPARWGALIVDLDFLSNGRDVNAIKNDISAFRQICPYVPTILLSVGFAADDLVSPEATGYDVALKLPVKSRVLKEAIAIRSRNNINCGEQEPNGFGRRWPQMKNE